MKKVENYLETLKLKKCLFGGIAPKQIEIVIQEICMLYDLELYNKNNELEQERKKNEQQDIRMEKVAEYVRQVLETLRSQIQETNHQLNQSSSAYLIGSEFGIKTVYTSLLLPLFLGIFEVVFPDFTSINGDPMLDTVCYIFVVSIGLAMLFKQNASSGGLDIVAKLLNKYFHMELGKAMALPGMCVALSSALFYDKKIVVLSILGTYLNGIVLDHFIFGMNLKKRVCIVSEKEEKIREFIIHTLRSGATMYDCVGAYDNQPKREIITIVNKSEYSQLMSFILKTDPKAFVTVYTVNEIIYRPKY